MKKKRHSFTMELDDGLRKRLDDIATSENRSTAEMVRIAVRSFCSYNRLLHRQWIKKWRD